MESAEQITVTLSLAEARALQEHAGSMGPVGTVDHAALNRALVKLDKATDGEER